MAIYQLLLPLKGDGDGSAGMGSSSRGDGHYGGIVTCEGVIVDLLNEVSDVVSGIALEHRGHIVHAEFLDLALGGRGKGNTLSAEMLSAGGVVEHNDDGLMTRRGLGDD